MKAVLWGSQPVLKDLNKFLKEKDKFNNIILYLKLNGYDFIEVECKKYKNNLYHILFKQKKGYYIGISFYKNDQNLIYEIRLSIVEKYKEKFYGILKNINELKESILKFI